jgi:endonuclease/exonuclease/phosphatase family metal-dependent hydrolase
VELHVLAVHLGLRLSERRFQVKQIVDYLRSVRGSLVAVVGDFNDWLPGRSVSHMLDAELGASPKVPSFPVVRPLLALDRIWINPRAALTRVSGHYSPMARRASDHYPVVGEISVP